MEERRNPGARDDFLEKFFKLEAAVQRLTEHEREDRPKYEERYKEFSGRLIELEKMRLELSNGRLTALENRPVTVQLTAKDINELFDTRAEVHAGRLVFRILLSAV